jgi:hypothetical protein
MSPDWKDLLALAEKLEPEARRRFLEAVAGLRDQLDLEELADALVRRQVLSPRDLASDAYLLQRLEPLLETVQKGIEQAGALATATLASRLNVPMRFDIVNPFAVDYTQRRALNLITGITAEARQAIRDAVARGFTDGLTRREVSRVIRPVIGLNSRQAQALMNYRAQLLAQGLNADRVAALVDRYSAKLLRDRAATIARTEMMKSANGGTRLAWLQAVERKLLSSDVERKWTVTPDDRLCPYCAAMQGQTQRLDKPFVSPLDGRSVLDPPLHPRCRCVHILVIVRRKTLAA